MDGFTIGKLAEAAGVHVETVRYYERRGLLRQPPRPAGGYRRYSTDDLRRLQLIARGKSLGFTLTEIAELIGPAEPGGNSSPDDVIEAVQRKIDAIDERRRVLAATRARLQQLADLCADGDSGDCVALRVIS